MNDNHLLSWLTAPIRADVSDRAPVLLSAVADAAVSGAAFWHGLLLAGAAGVLVPLSVLITRYWKIVPGQDWPRVLDHPGWWLVHRLIGYGSAVAILIGIAMTFQGPSVEEPLNHPHSWIGWLAVFMLLVLLINGWQRGSTGGPGHRQQGTLVHLHEMPGDHYDLTPRRRWFEKTHKTLGYSLLLVFAGSVLTGLWLINAPRWTLLAISGWWLVLLVLALRWERQGRAVDGYQAKWGPGINHPGNRIPVLGWGSRRYSEDEFRRLSWVSRPGRDVAAGAPAVAAVAAVNGGQARQQEGTPPTGSGPADSGRSGGAPRASQRARRRPRPDTAVRTMAHAEAPAEADAGAQAEVKTKAQPDARHAEEPERPTV